MAGRPYVTSRSGRFQWMMQRVSAVLLLVLVFVHFGLQHFTSAAVTTGLTVSAKFNDPWWQSFYVLFVILGLYHGVNGLIGIVYDYMPKPLVRGIIAMTLWTLAAVFGVLGIANVVDPRPLSEVKQRYASHGLSLGTSRGNPPLAAARDYDYRQDVGELPMLRYYLVHHTHHDREPPVEAIFGPDRKVSADRSEAVGAAFDTWLLQRIAAGAPPPEDKDGGSMFTSTFEFAVWAANVRRANALAVGKPAVLARLADVPTYDPAIH